MSTEKAEEYSQSGGHKAVGNFAVSCIVTALWSSLQPPNHIVNYVMYRKLMHAHDRENLTVY